MTRPRCAACEGTGYLPCPCDTCRTTPWGCRSPIEPVCPECSGGSESAHESQVVEIAHRRARRHGTDPSTEYRRMTG